MGKATITSTMPTVLDLFAGAGGFSLGFHWAGFHTAAAIDHNNFAVETLTTNFGPNACKALHRDLSKYSPSAFEKELRIAGVIPRFDVIIGGPPCQGWSHVGRGKLRSLRLQDGGGSYLEDPRNKLYRRFIAYISHFRPDVAVMENVPGMLSHDGQNIADSVAASIKSIGYKVTWKLLNASDYGVPQERRRLIFVGIKTELNTTFEFPEVVGPRGRRLFPHVNVKEAIGDLPRITNGANEWVRDYTKSKKMSSYARMMRRNSDRLFDHVCRSQNNQDIEAFTLMKQGGTYNDLPKRLKRYRDDIFKDKYKKLRMDRPSWCVTAHLSKDCYTHIHPTQARTISVREAARLQSFPDNFYFAGSMGNKFQLIGNAVPPLMAKHIAEAIRCRVFAKGIINNRKAS